MIVPYRVDVPFEHRPWGNYVIVAVIILVFAWQMNVVLTTPDPEKLNETFAPLLCDGWNIKGLVAHMWMHGGIMHVIGNLIFLWVFGNAVAGKINNLIYLPAYLVCGFIAAFSHNIFLGGPMLGASGAINGVVGMYLVMFPINDISCFYVWYFRPGTFTVSSYWMIIMWFAFDIFGAVIGGGGVAYFAHIGGFLSGVAISIALLKSRIVVMNERYEQSIFDVFKRKDVDYKTNRSLDYYDYEQKIHEKKLNQENHPQTEKVVVEQAPLNPGISDDDFFSQPSAVPIQEFIRFRCNCTQKIKVPVKYAGKTGKCPKCKNRIKIPILNS